MEIDYLLDSRRLLESVTNSLTPKREKPKRKIIKEEIERNGTDKT